MVHGEFPSPISGDSVELLAVIFVETGNARLHGHVTKRIGEQRLYGNQHFGERQSRAPIVSERITDVSVPGNIGMEYFCDKPDLRMRYRVSETNANVNVQVRF